MQIDRRERTPRLVPFLQHASRVLYDFIEDEIENGEEGGKSASDAVHVALGEIDWRGETRPERFAEPAAVE